MVFDQDSTFVRRDVDILKEVWDVEDHHFNSKPKWKTISAFAKLLFKLVFKRYDLVVTQSAGYLSLVPALLGKWGKHKCVIIVIGTDGACLPEINYGHFIRQPLAWATCRSLSMANLILPVHRSLESSTYTYDKVQHVQQGFRAFCPEITTQVVEIVNGYDHDRFHILTPWEERPLSFLTVAAHLSHVSFRRKGLDLIFDFAVRNPHLNFTVVSQLPTDIQIPENVHLLPNVPQNELVAFYNQHKYYLQLSMFEGFPNALCEAMLCGCVPIGSNVAAIPEIIGEEGYLLQHKDVDELTAIVQTVSGSSKNPRQRIQQNFPLSRRSKELREALQNA
ncbi:MAG: glycosyltransferase family 4 protein [Flavobacteriales bacterium]|nr:glycosyltransferase family 4 protein [Flavobacteriales bacterium]